MPNWFLITIILVIFGVAALGSLTDLRKNSQAELSLRQWPYYFYHPVLGNMDCRIIEQKGDQVKIVFNYQPAPNTALPEMWLPASKVYQYYTMQEVRKMSKGKSH